MRQFISISLLTLVTVITFNCKTPEYRYRKYLDKFNRVISSTDLDSISVILKVDTHGSYPFNKKYSNYNPANDEISSTNEIFSNALKKYNTDTLVIKRKIDFPGTYKRQIVYVKSKDDHKLVWVNVFCQTIQANWRTEIISVFDGGRCYFQVLIDLTEQKVLEFAINGIG